MDNFNSLRLHDTIKRIKEFNKPDPIINRFDKEKSKKTEICASYDVSSSEELKELHQKHPHVSQNKQAGITHTFTRTLDDSMPRLKYRRRKNEFKSVLHWGQRKLLLVEIEFLTKFASDGDIVLYAGAAPGNHIPYLSNLFPTLEFALFDPNDFAIKGGDNIRICQQYFTEEIAHLFAGRDDVLFISDIRTASPSMMGLKEIEVRVENDNNAQMRWYEIINAKKTMLKFRLPWPVPFELDASGELIPSPHDSKTPNKTYKWVTKGGEKFVYLKGDIYIQPWAPQTSTETRLVIDPFDKDKGPVMTTYNNTEYEERMFYFNNVMRPSLFPHKVKGEGLDHCYDCATETEILTMYLIKYKKLKINTIDIFKQVSKMSMEISRLLGSRRLNQPQPPPNHRTFRPTKLVEQGYDGNNNKNVKKNDELL